MSTDIFYDKQFIRVKNKFVPMILGGSSNCFEVGRSYRQCGRRSRSWNNNTYITDGEQMATAEEILGRCEKIREGYLKDPEYSDDGFGWHTALAIRAMNGKTTFAMFKNWYQTGIKKALTVEQLTEEGIEVVVQMWDYNDESKNKAIAEGLPWLETTIVKTTDELIQAVELYEKTYTMGYSWSVGFGNNDRAEKLVPKIRAKYFGEKVKEYEYIRVDKYYTVVINHNGREYYFAKKTRRGFKYGYAPYLKFATEKEANTFANRYKDHYALSTEEVNEMGMVKVLKK